MDYETKPLSRKEIRFISKLIRKKYNITSLKFPVIEILEKLYDDYNVTYVIEEDKKFKKGVMAYLNQNNDTTYTIHIRESVYDGAVSLERGDCLGFICHEICHFFLIEVFGYRPIYGRCVNSRTIRPCRSMEWQAKALCGELMIPFEECKNMSLNEIVTKTNSSYEQTIYFLKNVK